MTKAILKTGKFTFNSVDYGVTALEFTKSAGEVDLTDTNTAGNEKEYAGGRIEKTFQITIWKDVTQLDPPISESHPATIDFEGYTYDGVATLTEVTNSASIDEGVQLTVTGRFSGTVTETPATP
jgi:hypothetical protein